MVSMHSPSYGGLRLSVMQHLGNIVSWTQADGQVREG